eukprot:263317-Pyramimonas_sp.AAC.1
MFSDVPVTERDRSSFGHERLGLRSLKRDPDAELGISIRAPVACVQVSGLKSRGSQARCP